MSTRPSFFTMAGMMVCSGRFARPDAVGVAGVGHEAGAAVLQRDAGPRRHHAGAEAVIDRVDEGDGQPLLVHHGQVDGVGVAHRGVDVEGPVHVDHGARASGRSWPTAARPPAPRGSPGRRCGGCAVPRRASSPRSRGGGASTESGAWRRSPICDRMLRAISAVSPWPEGGISSTSWPMKSVEIGFTQVDSWAARSSMREERALGPDGGDDVLGDGALVEGVAALAGDQPHAPGQRRDSA